MHLTVIHPFTIQGDKEKQVPDRELQRGDKIMDADDIEQVLEGENKHHVVKTADNDAE